MRCCVMAAKRDYYEVLGIGKNASTGEIKKAYRRLAREYHPDVSKLDRKVAEEKGVGRPQEPVGISGICCGEDG